MMKIGSILIAVTLLFVNIVSAGDWHRIPTGIQDDLRGIHFCSDTLGFGATVRGMVLKFHGPKLTPQIDTLCLDTLLEDIYFFGDCRRGFVFGAKGSFYRTENGGLKWQKQPFDSSLWLCDLAFKDSQIGFLIGYNIHSPTALAAVFKTIDAGQHWDSLPLSASEVSSVDISPDGVISLAGRGQIHISYDDGASWESPPIKEGVTVKGIAIRGENGIAVGLGGYLGLSSDHGKSWKTWEALPFNFHSFSFLALDTLEALAGGHDGTVIHTLDAGKNWVPEASAIGFTITDFQKVGEKVFASGLMGALIYREPDR